MKSTILNGSAAVVLAVLATGCGELAQQGTGPAQVVISQLQAASGAQPDQFSGTLNSDVITNVEQTVNNQTVLVPTVFNDIGQVTMSLILKDPGQPGIAAAPTPLNQITFTRYRVVYRRSDGRNTQGVDVPFPFESAATFTVPADGTVTAAFEIVRHTAKQEAPLAALRSNPTIISTIAEVSFFGRDQAGNNVTAVGNIGILFGNFGDPQ